MTLNQHVLQGCDLIEYHFIFVIPCFGGIKEDSKTLVKIVHQSSHLRIFKIKKNQKKVLTLKSWKYIVAVGMTLVIAAGILITIPMIPILEQTARNIFFHVPMWMAMFSMFTVSFYYSIKYLNKPDLEFDIKAESAANVGVIFGICGLLTGSLWARFTWGTWWTFAEPKMNLAALAVMIYYAYFVLRSAFDDEEKRAKLSAVYNIFAVTTIPFLLYIVPRQLDSLHPGAEGNPAFSEITAPELRYILYPAFIGFIALAFWIYDIVHRYKTVQHHTENS